MSTKRSSQHKRMIVGYLRVSTDRQAEKGLGLDVQRQAIKAWASSSGSRVTGYLADEGVSGSYGLESRVALALADALERAATRPR